MSFHKKIWDKVKDFGFYQIRIFILVSVLEISAAIAMVLPVLAHAKLNFRCSFLRLSQNATDSFNSSYDSDQEEDLSKIFATNQTHLSFCDNCCDQSCSDITFSSKFTSIVSEWNLTCSQASVSSFINTLTMIGLFCGGFVSGQLSDQFGRKKVVYGSFTLLLIFQLISGVVTSWKLYCMCRFFIGALISSLMVSNFILPMEYVSSKWRTFIGCIGFWPVGIIVLSVWGYFVRDWRYLTISTACVGFPMLVTWWFVTESPRWLYSHGRRDAATKILQVIEEHNKAPPIELIRINESIREDEEKKLKKKKYSYCHLFSSVEMTKKTLILNYGWFVCCGVYYGLIFATKNLSGNRYINLFLSGIVELPAVFLVVGVNNRFGRKKTIIMLVGISGVSMFIMIFSHIAGKYNTYPNFILTMAMLAKFGITGGWAALQVLSAESFPTVVRSLGFSSCSMIARIGAVTAIQIISLDEISRIAPLCIFGIECLLFVGLLLCLPETAGMPLKDIFESKKENFPDALFDTTDMKDMNTMNETQVEDQNKPANPEADQTECMV